MRVTIAPAVKLDTFALRKSLGFLLFTPFQNMIDRVSREMQMTHWTDILLLKQDWTRVVCDRSYANDP
jgi:hypothetical protein